jgi:Lrp/AsnC family leucine-responsive transcriptional regulator
MANIKDTPPQDRRPLDRTDRRILAQIQANGRLTNKQLAELVNLSPTPCLRRLNLLEQAGYIERYRAILSPAKLGYSIRAFLTIKRTRESHRETVWQRMLAIPEVIACHVISGEFDLLVEVVARDMEHYANLTLKTITSIDGVHDLRSTFSIQALKTDGDFPIVEPNKSRP